MLGNILGIIMIILGFDGKEMDMIYCIKRVTNLKLTFSRLRDKMLVFVGLVQKNATWTVMSIGRRVTQVLTCALRLRSKSNCFFEA